MIRMMFPFLSKSEYQDLSLRGYDDRQRSPLACLNETTITAPVTAIPE